MNAVDPLLLALVRQRDELDRAIGLRATEIVRAWMIKTDRAHLCVDDEHRSLAVTNDRSELLDDSTESRLHGFAFDGLNDAIGNLPRHVIRWNETDPSGHTVIMADLNAHIDRVHSDRNPSPIASLDPWERG